MIHPLSKEWIQFIQQGIKIHEVLFFLTNNSDVPATGDCLIESLLASGAIPSRSVAMIKESITSFCLYDNIGIETLKKIVSKFHVNPKHILANIATIGQWCGLDEALIFAAYFGINIVFISNMTTSGCHELTFDSSQILTNQLQCFDRSQFEHKPVAYL